MSWLIWERRLLYVIHSMVKPWAESMWGSNMVLLALTSVGPLTEVSKPEPERQRFQHIPRGPADVNASGKHVWSLLLHKNILTLENFERMLRKVLFSVPIMERKGKLHVNVLKMPLPGQRLTLSWCHKLTSASMLVTEDDVSFCGGPRNAYT